VNPCSLLLNSDGGSIARNCLHLHRAGQLTGSLPTWQHGALHCSSNGFRIFGRAERLGQCSDLTASQQVIHTVCPADLVGEKLLSIFVDDAGLSCFCIERQLVSDSAKQYRAIDADDFCEASV
jgi:hypothetical protein